MKRERTDRRRVNVYVGIDNGVSGTIGVLYPCLGDVVNYEFYKMPTYSVDDYSHTKTKKRKNSKKKRHARKITLVNPIELMNILQPFADRVIIMIERPFVNPHMFRSSLSAVRCLGAIFAVLDLLGVPRNRRFVIDSRSWQRYEIPGVKGKDLKKQSRRNGRLKFPDCTNLINKHGDADGLLIAEHCRRENS